MKAESLLRTARSRFAPLNALTRPNGTLSPSEGVRERERGPFLEPRFMVSDVLISSADRPEQSGSSG
jgi:hypothetical protein